MNKRDFYLAAIKAEAFLITAWNISCFSIVQEGSEDWKKNPYPYRIVQLGNGHHFVSPDDTTQLVKIIDAPAGQPLFKRLEGVTIDVGELPNVNKTIYTTYTNILVNALMVIRPFRNKIEFITGRFSAKKIEGMLEKRLAERPENWDGAPEEVEGDPDNLIHQVLLWQLDYLLMGVRQHLLGVGATRPVVDDDALHTSLRCWSTQEDMAWTKSAPLTSCAPSTSPGNWSMVLSSPRNRSIDLRRKPISAAAAFPG